MRRDHDIVLAFFRVTNADLRVRSLTNLLIVDGRRDDGGVGVVVVAEEEVLIRIARSGFWMDAREISSLLRFIFRCASSTRHFLVILQASQ